MGFLADEPLEQPAFQAAEDVQCQVCINHGWIGLLKDDGSRMFLECPSCRNPMKKEKP